MDEFRPEWPTMPWNEERVKGLQSQELTGGKTHTKPLQAPR